jgi:small subunit ribosomal protein SAe
MVDLYFYRDPEAEAESKELEEAKVPGADEVGAAAIESGIAAGGDWEVSGASAGAFAAASATPAAGSGWEAGAGDEWATPAAGTAEWGAAEGTKETTAQW